MAWVGRGMHPLPVGTVVHHQGGRYSVADDRPRGSYWGTIMAWDGPWPDGSYEYLVARASRRSCRSTRLVTWWASYHLDRTLDPDLLDAAVAASKGA